MIRYCDTIATSRKNSTFPPKTPNFTFDTNHSSQYIWGEQGSNVHFSLQTSPESVLSQLVKSCEI
ncbi:hypothetical protein FHS27_002113 [Rhodopirellula rubra]|uniref:Uncharacterized protein n=1 Tax=Aporhodopirellula rubra TaxID=980271 RepID=A0A7W5H5C6_9BACT|nr:hypothetical protein [Aporhodopirellula rubra]